MEQHWLTHQDYCLPSKNISMIVPFSLTLGQTRLLRITRYHEHKWVLFMSVLFYFHFPFCLNFTLAHSYIGTLEAVKSASVSISARVRQLSSTACALVMLCLYNSLRHGHWTVDRCCQSSINWTVLNWSMCVSLTIKSSTNLLNYELCTLAGLSMSSSVQYRVPCTDTDMDTHTQYPSNQMAPVCIVSKQGK